MFSRTELKGLMKGLAVIFLLALLSVLTISYPDFFLRYSGIFTFYSLLAIFILFIFERIIKINEQKVANYTLLKSLDQEVDLIASQLEYFAEDFSKGQPPVHNMIQFQDIYRIFMPHQFGSKNMINLKKKIAFANDKINTLNWMRDSFWDTVWNYDDKELKKFAKRPLIQQAFSVINTALRELRVTLKDIKDELNACGVH